ncbi:MAG: hypothetical protein WC449_06365, partial [Candidatus Paceibacterota bacterium]
MSELGKFDNFTDWLDFRFNHGSVNQIPVSKKLSWLQKIRGYDDLQARCNSAEAMRDHYKTIMTEALRDRDLHARTADNWQQKAIDANVVSQELGKYLDKYDVLGKRLKFSVCHNHVTIVVGNPVTYCQNLETDKERIGWSASMCSKKDVYNWKIGVIQSLDNLCDEKKYSQKLRRDLRKALAKKYPEVFK